MASHRWWAEYAIGWFHMPSCFSNPHTNRTQTTVAQSMWCLCSDSVTAAEIHEQLKLSSLQHVFVCTVTSLTTTAYLQQSWGRRAPAGRQLWGQSPSLRRWTAGCSDKSWRRRCSLAGDQTQRTPRDAQCWPEVHFSFALWKNSNIKTCNLWVSNILRTVGLGYITIHTHRFDLSFEKQWLWTRLTSLINTGFSWTDKVVVMIHCGQ